jgi:hypothetical protein
MMKIAAIENCSNAKSVDMAAAERKFYVENI